MDNMKKILIILPIILILIIGGFFYRQYLLTDDSGPIDKTDEQEFNDSGRAKAIENETDLWKFYNYDKEGFSIKYPSELSLNIKTTQIDLLDYPGFGKQEALKNIEDLNQGNYGDDFDWPLEVSKKS